MLSKTIRWKWMWKRLNTVQVSMLKQLYYSSIKLKHFHKGILFKKQKAPSVLIQLTRAKKHSGPREMITTYWVLIFNYFTGWGKSTHQIETQMQFQKKTKRSWCLVKFKGKTVPTATESARLQCVGKKCEHIVSFYKGNNLSYKVITGKPKQFDSPP